MIMHNCPLGWLTQLGRKGELSQCGISFLFLCCQFLKQGSFDSLLSEETIVFPNYYPKTWKHCIRPPRFKRIHWKVIKCKFVISVFFVLCVFSVVWPIFLWMQKMYATVSDSNCVLICTHHNSQEVNTQHWDASDQNTSLIRVFFLGQDHTNTCSSWEETRGFEEPSVNQSFWEAN